ncbi:MAG: hypothetical protein AAF441_00025 [Pseudomonadota bacterium]
MASRISSLQGPEPSDEYIEIYDDFAYILCYVTAMALSFREQAVACFPRVFREALWESNSAAIPSEGGLALPWEPAGSGPGEPSSDLGLPTITLSLDLRKSTIAMRESRDRKLYSYWIKAFVILLRKIADDNLAVFDKFTGDGVILHFLEDHIDSVWPACLASAPSEARLDMADNLKLDFPPGSPTSRRWRKQRLKRLRATYLAARCAKEMISATGHLLDHLLRDNLRFTSNMVGSRVGIACDPAIWTADQDGNPIVVGEGVVHACRLTDAKPQKGLRKNFVLLQGDLVSLLKSGFLDLALKKIIWDGGKDHGSEDKLQVWSLGDLPDHLVRSDEELSSLALQTWTEVLSSDARYADSSTD